MLYTASGLFKYTGALTGGMVYCTLNPRISPLVEEISSTGLVTLSAEALAGKEALDPASILPGAPEYVPGVVDTTTVDTGIKVLLGDVNSVAACIDTL